MGTSPIIKDTYSVYVFIVLGLFLTILGTVGNITSLVVLTRSSLRKLKIQPYLMALAVFDLLILYLLLFPALAFIKQGKEEKTRTTLQCRMGVYWGFFVLDCSSWIIVAISIERLLYLARPHMVRPQRDTTIALSLVIGLAAVINIPITMGCNVINNKCITPDHYYLIHFIISSYIPATIMAAVNIYIVYTLCYRPNLDSTSSSKLHNSIRMVIVINLVFLSTNLPVSIVWAIVGKLYLLLFLLLYANYAMNFLMYIIAEELFRKELNAMLYRLSKCCRKEELLEFPSNKIAPSIPSTTKTSV